MIEIKLIAKNFDLVGCRQHGVASNEVIGWSTDHLLNADGDDLGGRNRIGRREKWPKQSCGGGRNRGKK